MKRKIVAMAGCFTCVAALSQTAVPTWVQRYNATGTGDSVAVATMVNKDGNVIVTGHSWNGSNMDFATLAYSRDGAPLWTNRYDGPAHGTDRAVGMAVDNNGHVIVLGYSDGIGTGYNYATIAYSSTGVPLWTNRYRATGAGVHDELPSAVVVDKSNNVFVTGYSWGGTKYEYATLAYSENGLPVWTNRYGNAAGVEDQARALATDNNGNVFVTGKSFNAVSIDYATLAYSKTGTKLWTNRFGYRPDIFTAIDSIPNGIAVDSSGKLFVTGSFLSTPKYLTVGLSAAGVTLWTNLFGSPAAESVANAIAVGKDDKVFITGYSRGVGTDYDFVTIAYANGGVPLWTNRYSGLGSGADRAMALTIDKVGNVVVTGYATNSVGNEYATVAYSSEGTGLWTNRYKGAVAGNHYGKAVATDDNGNVYVTGYAWNGSNYEYLTIKYALSVPLSIAMKGSQPVVSWTNAAFGWTNLAFELQTAPSVDGTFTNVPGATSPYTNAITEGQKFFRLISN